MPKILSQQPSRAASNQTWRTNRTGNWSWAAKPFRPAWSWPWMTQNVGGVCIYVYIACIYDTISCICTYMYLCMYSFISYKPMLRWFFLHDCYVLTNSPAASSRGLEPLLCQQGAVAWWYLCFWYTSWRMAGATHRLLWPWLTVITAINHASASLTASLPYDQPWNLGSP